MTHMLLAISTFQMINIILVMIALLIGFKYLESFWSYKISKPYAWEVAVKKKEVPKEILKIERSYRDKVRLYNLWFQITRLKKIGVQGAFAELGVHQGDTAKIIHHLDTNRRFYLFDTFSGFSKKDLEEETQRDSRFSEDNFADTSVESVLAYMEGNNNIIVRSGLFPDTAVGLENESFAFVNVDADLYAPTLSALQFFYPRLSPEGVILVHDYNHNWDGVPKAVEEFCSSIPESIMELSDWQGSVMLIKNK